MPNRVVRGDAPMIKIFWLILAAASTKDVQADTLKNKATTGFPAPNFTFFSGNLFKVE
jgi:hypothetical protein